jgi:hypothetical protein
MRKAALSLFVLALSGLAASAACAKPPVVVELFTAQGCTSCIKANQLAADLAERDGVLALTYSVDYWDYLGWKDTFAKPGFAERQRAYVKKFALRDVPTPQVVVGGRVQASGAKAEAVEDLVKTAAKAPLQSAGHGICRQDPRRGRLGSRPARRRRGVAGAVRSARAADRRQARRQQGPDPGPQERRARAGSPGPWAGKPKLYRLPAHTDDDLETVIIVQGAKGGRILGVLETAER